MQSGTQIVDGGRVCIPTRNRTNRRERRLSGPRAGTALKSAEVEAGSHRLAMPVKLFLLAQLLPWIITIGPVRMSTYRFVLLAFIVPCFVALVSGKAGRIRVADLALLFYSLWCALAIVMVHGAAYAMQPAGIIFLETMGAYVLARCYIRSADDFYNMAMLMFTMVALLLPFAIMESVTGRNIAGEILGMIYPTFPDAPTEPRWGLRRAQVIFEHSILYGVNTASVLALTHIVLGYEKTFSQRWARTAIVPLAAFFSLSSGPLSALAVQAFLLVWNWSLGAIAQRWKILIGAWLIVGVSLDLLSNRSLPAIFISFFAFDEGSGQARLLIWQYGTGSALNHPLFGVGFNDWDRPSWMSPSIDMLWIIDAVRHGIPAEFFILAAFFATVLPVAFKKLPDKKTNAYRTAYLISMTGFFLAGWTVYFWNATYVLFIFMLGSGAWLVDVKGEPEGSGRAQKTLSSEDSEKTRQSRRGAGKPQRADH